MKSSRRFSRQCASAVDRPSSSTGPRTSRGRRPRPRRPGPGTRSPRPPWPIRPGRTRAAAPAPARRAPGTAPRHTDSAGDPDSADPIPTAIPALSWPVGPVAASSSSRTSGRRYRSWSAWSIIGSANSRVDDPAMSTRVRADDVTGAPSMSAGVVAGRPAHRAFGVGSRTSGPGWSRRCADVSERSRDDGETRTPGRTATNSPRRTRRCRARRSALGLPVVRMRGMVRARSSMDQPSIAGPDHGRR